MEEGRESEPEEVSVVSPESVSIVLCSFVVEAQQQNIVDSGHSSPDLTEEVSNSHIH